MNVSRPVRKTHASVTLTITFLLGILLGISLSYAYFDAIEKDFSHEVKLSDAPPVVNNTPQTSLEIQNDSLPEFQPDTETALWAAKHLFLSINEAKLNKDQIETLKSLRPAGVALGADALDNNDQIRDLIASLRENTDADYRPLVLFAADPMSHLKALGLSALPNPKALGELNDPKTTEDTGKILGQALSEVGIDIVLNPRLDVFHPRYSDKALLPQSFGNSAESVRIHGLAYAQGLLAGGVLPVVTTFPGLGAAKKDPNGAWTIPLAAKAGQKNEKLELRELAELMFPFSEAAVKQTPGFLVGCIAVPALDREAPKRPATESPKLVHKLIRETWAYDGVLLADYRTKTVDEKNLALSLGAGCDAILMPAGAKEEALASAKAIAQALNNKALKESEIHASQKRLFAWRSRCHPLTTAPSSAAQKDQKADMEATETKVEKAAETINQEEKIESLPEKAPQDSASDLPEATPETGKTEEEKPDSTSIPPQKISEDSAPTDPILQAPEEKPETGEGEIVEPENKAEEEQIEETSTTEEKQAETEVEENKDSDPPTEEEMQTEAAKEMIESLLEEKEEASAAEEREESPPVEKEQKEAQPKEESKTEVVTSEIVEAIKPEETSPQEAPVQSSTKTGEAEAANKAQEKEDPPLTQTPDTAGESPQDAPEKEEPEKKKTELPEEVQFHTVVSGDTMSNISRRYNTSKEVIMQLNKISNPNIVKLGQKLKVPKQD